MHVVGEPAGIAGNAIQHLLVVTEWAMRRAEVDGNLAVALRAIATINRLTHIGIMTPSGCPVGDRRHRAYMSLANWSANTQQKAGKAHDPFAVRFAPLLRTQASTKLQRLPSAEDNGVVHV